MTDFMGLPADFRKEEGSRVVIIPVPFEGDVSYGKGASKGPLAILKASRELEYYDLETDKEPYSVGIFTDVEVQALSSAEVVDKVYDRIRRYEDRFPVLIGGDHSISVGAIKRFSEIHELTVLHLDAHLDLRDDFHNDRMNHACVMRRAREYGAKIVHVGIRSMDIEEKEYVDMSDVFPAPFADYDRIIDRLGKKVYLSIDLDVFDPSVIPSTGTPEPGGLDWYQVTALLRRVFMEREVVGADVVELSPIEGLTYPDFTAAKLIYKLISYKYGEEPRRESP